MSIREPGIQVEFVMHAVVHGQRSKEEGREVCVDKPHVKIRVAGNDKEEFFGPVTDQIKARFPEEWDAFQKGVEVAKVGTPIEHWPKLTHQPSMVRTLKNFAIFTVEDMASCSDAALQKIGMGGQDLRASAQKFITTAKVGADAGKLTALEQENADLREKFALMQEQMAELLVAKKPKGKTKAAEQPA